MAQICLKLKRQRTKRRLHNVSEKRQYVGKKLIFNKSIQKDSLEISKLYNIIFSETIRTK